MRGEGKTALVPKKEGVGDDGITNLMHAVRSGTLDEVRTLLATGADPNASDRHGNTSLHKAAIAGSVVKVQLLFDHGGRLEAHNRFGRTALHEAANIGWRDVCKLLVRLGARHDAKDGPLLDGQTYRRTTRTPADPLPADRRSFGSLFAGRPFQVAHANGWTDVCAALKANERRRVKLAGGDTSLFSCDFSGIEPGPFSPRRMNANPVFGASGASMGCQYGIWGRPADKTKPLFISRVTA